VLADELNCIHRLAEAFVEPDVDCHMSS
jgi:hypothetical protein